jgi:small subunit ribosomal protein S4
MRRPGQPRDKISRRFGVDIYGTGGASLQRRLDTPPGGRRNRRRKPSQYAIQLDEKQKVRAMYGVEERQFRRYFEQAGRRVGPHGANLLTLLERRLDNFVYRLGFARSRPMARQLVSHGHIRVDGQRVNVPSFSVEQGQTISVAPGATDIPALVEELGSGRPLPAWLERVEPGPAGRVVRLPEREDIELPIDERLIVGYYAR